FLPLQAGSSFLYLHTSSKDGSPLESSFLDAMASSRFPFPASLPPAPADSPALLSPPTSTPVRDTQLRSSRLRLRTPAPALAPAHSARSAAATETIGSHSAPPNPGRSRAPAAGGRSGPVVPRSAPHDDSFPSAPATARTCDCAPPRS